METKTEADKVIVEVKPADPKVVYVPQYDPQAAYTPPPAPAAAPAPATTTTTTEEKGVSTGAAVATGIIAFGAGLILANALDDDDDYCYPNWGHGAVYYGPRPFYPPAYVYRPAYGPAFRPAYGYAPPANYRHSYNNVNVRNNVNVNINNSRNDYFNRFDNNQNLRAGSAQSPLGRDAAGRRRRIAPVSLQRRGALTTGRASPPMPARATRRAQGIRRLPDRMQATGRTAERARARREYQPAHKRKDAICRRPRAREIAVMAIRRTGKIAALPKIALRAPRTRPGNSLAAHADDRGREIARQCVCRRE